MRGGANRGDGPTAFVARFIHAARFQPDRMKSVMSSKPLTLAAIQMRSEPLQLERNLAHAETLVEQAARQGAKLVLLPELMPGGYRLTEEIQHTARPFDGAVTEWLAGLARRLDIHLGTTFLEQDGADFYNTFALATPAGRIAGRVRKAPAASVEAYFYRAGDDAHHIDTDLGRIGVGICYENLLHERLLGLHRARVDLVLQPSAAGRPVAFLPGDIARFERMLRDYTPYYTRAPAPVRPALGRAGAVVRLPLAAHPEEGGTALRRRPPASG